MTRPRGRTSASWAPDASDLVWLEFDPQSGREQRGHRPALVLSPLAYNRKTGLALVCPITTHQKGYPFEVPLPAGLRVSGVILADHLKSLDWKSRQATLAGRAPDAVVTQVKILIETLLDLGR